MRAIADRLRERDAYLMTRAGFVRVNAQQALGHFVAVVETKPPASSYLRIEDHLLTSRMGDDGLALGYAHPNNAYEFELITWGRYRFDLSRS